MPGGLCGFGGTCIDPSNASLEDGLAPGPVVQISPNPSWRTPDRWAVNSPLLSAARVDGPTLSLITPQGVKTASVSPPVSSLQWLEEGELFIADAAGVTRVNPDTLGRVTVDGTVRPDAQLRAGPSRPQALFLLHRAGTAVISGSGGRLPPITDTSAVFDDIAALGGAPNAFIASNSRGLFVVSRDSEGRFINGGTTGDTPLWRPVYLPTRGHLDCAASNPPAHFEKIRTRVSSSHTFIGLQYKGTSQAALYSLATPIKTTGSCETIASASSQVSRIFDRCDLCPPGATLIDFHHRRSSSVNGLLSYCSQGEAAQSYVTFWEARGCNRALHRPPLTSPVRPLEPTTTNGGMASAGELRVCGGLVDPDDTGTVCRPLILASQPRSVFSYAGGTLGALSHAFPRGPGSVPLTSSYDLVPGAGFWFARGDAFIRTLQRSVVDRPTWVTSVTSEGTDIGTVRIFDTAALTQHREVIHATQVPNAIDTTSKRPHEITAVYLEKATAEEDAVVVAVGEALMSVAIRRDRTLPAVPLVLETRLVPAPRLPIDRLALKRADISGYLEGALLTRQRLFMLSVANPIRWTTRELAIPVHSTPVEVFFQGSRGRIIFRDGSVYAIPELVRIADPPVGTPFPPDRHDVPPPAFASLCGNIYALANERLYRLGPLRSGDNWEEILLPKATSQALGSGDLFAIGSALVAAMSNGAAFRLEHPGCSG